MGTFDRAIAPVPSSSQSWSRRATAAPAAGSRLGALARVIESSPVARRDGGAQGNKPSATPLAQLAAAARADQPATVQRRAANRTGLPDALKANAEARSGVSLDDVRVHYNSTKPSQLQAHAYAQGANIYLAPGQERHLPHETGHVVQQKKGLVTATRHLNGVPLNDEPRLEAQADGFGRDVARQGGTAQRMVVHGPVARPVAQAFGWKEVLGLIGQARPGVLTILRRMAVVPRGLPGHLINVDPSLGRQAANAVATHGTRFVGAVAGPATDVARTAVETGLSTTDMTLAWRFLRTLATFMPQSRAGRAAVALPVIGGLAFAFYRAGLHRLPLFQPIVPLVRALSGGRLGGSPPSSTTVTTAPGRIGHQQRRGFSTQVPGRDKGSIRQAPLNRAKGAAFEDEINDILAHDFPGAKKVRNVTVRHKDSGTKVRLDFLVFSDNAYLAFEAKSSATASYTRNQTVVFPLMDCEILQTGISSVELRSNVPTLGLKVGETIVIKRFEIYRHKEGSPLQPTSYSDDIGH